MKKQLIFTAGFALLTLMACENEPHFQVAGEIKDASDKTLYFEAAGIDGISIIDSAKLSRSGSFKFKYKSPDSPDFFRLRVDNRIINLGIDSTETVTVKANLATMPTDYTVEGSEESLKIKELSLKQIELQETIKKLSRQGFPPGVLQDSVLSLIDTYKQQVKKDYIFKAPRNGYAYYALFQKINGLLLFDPETNREDVKCFAAVATSWDNAYPHSLRSANLHNIAMRGMKNTRPVQTSNIPQALISEVTLFDVSLPDIKGNLKTLSELKGKVVLLDFTVYQNQASPARNILLRELHTAFAERGLEIYQVSLDTDEHFWKTSASNLPWICVRDAEGTAARTYNVQELPTYFLINRNNELYKRSSDVENLNNEIQKLLSAK